ncbi:arginase family protein, partial [Halomonas sp. EGI 63088]
LGKAVNCLNIDAHTDFRNREGRHSGNGFSYAFHEGFLDHYFVFGLHENYTSKKVFKTISKEKQIRFNTFEELFVRKEKGFEFELNEALDFVKTSRFGLEIDMDSVTNMPSSARTSSGMALNTVREIIFKSKKSKNIAYLHICEAAPDMNSEAEKALTGKSIAYLVSDFIRK